jgi:hypothetical protein
MGTMDHNFDTATPVTPLGYSNKGYILVPWVPSMASGEGYDSVSHAVLPSAAIDEFALEEKPQGEGQTGQLKIKQVQTIEEVSQLISIQSDLKVGYDVFSSTAVGRFLRERRMNKFSLYFLVLSYMERALVKLKGFNLNAKARQLALNPAEFRAMYGDYCVEGYIAGGYLIGLAELQVSSEQTLTEVQALVRGKYDRMVTVDGGVEGAWKNLERMAGTDFSMHVIHAGLGEGIRAHAMPGQGGSGAWGETPRVPTGGQGGGAGTASSGTTSSSSRVSPAIRAEDESPRNVEGAGTASPVIPKSLTKEWEDGGDDDPDDDKSEKPIAPDIPAITRPRNQGSGNGGSSTGPALSPIVNRLSDPPAEYIPALNMNLDGMLKAASALQAQSGKYRVRLLARLRHFSTLDGGPKTDGQIDIALKDLDKKREMLSKYYSKASYIHDSVRYALESRGQFTAKESNLLAIKREMEQLMDGPNGYTKLWEELKTSPQTVTFQRIGDGPDESKIPKWAVKKTPFQPFSKELEPQLFVNILNESVDKAIAASIPERREALKDYLKLVQENSGKNYANAILALETLSEVFPELDEQPARRTREIKSITTMVDKSMRAWASDSIKIHQKFNSLDGKLGLDQKQLEFLAPLNAIVFGGAEDARYGSQAFWANLHKELETLVQKSEGWKENQKLTDLIDYSNDWSNQAEAFKISSQELIAKVRRRLL